MKNISLIYLFCVVSVLITLDADQRHVCLLDKLLLQHSNRIEKTELYFQRKGRCQKRTCGGVFFDVLVHCQTKVMIPVNLAS